MTNAIDTIPTTVFNRAAFNGIFPRKGKKCARLTWRGETRWVPVSGPFLLAESIASSQTYVPTSHIDQGATPVDVALVWHGHTSHEPLVWLHDFPNGVVLARDLWIKAHSGPDTWHTRIPSGSRVLLKAPGDPHQSASWWVVPPE